MTTNDTLKPESNTDRRDANRREDSSTTIRRRSVLRAVGTGVALGLAGVGPTSAAPASFGDGVNL